MTSETPDTLAVRFAEVRATIAAACTRANRPVDSVMLVAVSKTHPAEMLIEAVTCGQAHFGENRVSEAVSKIAQVEAKVSTPLTWHMIGHVQSRKAETVIQNFDIIHSLDTVKLSERYSRLATAAQQDAQKNITVLLEVNVSGEESKEGFDAANWENRPEKRESLWNDIRRIIDLPGIRIGGLMTMAPIVDEMEQARPVFRSLRLLRDALATDMPQVTWDILSMGMTDDYPVAIEEGATIVRVGRALFGSRS